MGQKWFCDKCGKEIPNLYNSSDKDTVWSVHVESGKYHSLLPSLSICKKDAEAIVELIKQYKPKGE